MLGILCSWLLASYRQPVLYGSLVQCVTEQCTWLLDFCFYEWKSASCGICAIMLAWKLFHCASCWKRIGIDPLAEIAAYKFSLMAAITLLLAFHSTVVIEFRPALSLCGSCWNRIGIDPLAEIPQHVFFYPGVLSLCFPQDDEVKYRQEMLTGLFCVLLVWQEVSSVPLNFCSLEVFSNYGLHKSSLWLLMLSWDCWQVFELVEQLYWFGSSVDWPDDLIGPRGLLLVSHLFAVPVLILWVGLEKSK